MLVLCIHVDLLIKYFFIITSPGVPYIVHVQLYTVCVYTCMYTLNLFVCLFVCLQAALHFDPDGSIFGNKSTIAGPLAEVEVLHGSQF